MSSESPIKRAASEASASSSPAASPKRQRTDQTALGPNPAENAGPLVQTDNFAPQFHNLPSGGLPVVEPPLKVDDFFTDLDPAVRDPNVTNQLSKIVRLFPPPIPPNLPQEYLNGVMIPFIFPAPPVIKPDPYINDNRMFLRRKPRGKVHEQPDEYVELAPLPFPPPNYMPYPIIANKSSLTPHEVFSDFLEASATLPRIDMVVASAAGSLFAIREQATAENFTVRGYERAKRGRGAGESMTEAEFKASEDAYMEYARQVDTENTFDEKYRDEVDDATYELSKVSHAATTVRLPLSNEKNKPHQDSEDEAYEEYSSDIDYYQRVKDFLPISSEDYITNAEKDVTSANGNNKVRRKLDVSRASRQLQELEEDKKHEILAITKHEITQNLKNLRESKILLSDEDSELIKDQELIDMKNVLAEARDFELLQLKFGSNYDYLKTAMVFYQESNRSYRKFNSSITKKLLKLKNFFEYQRKSFSDSLNKEGREDDIFDVSSRDATKMFQDTSVRNYSHEIKDLLKLSISEPNNTEIPKLLEGLNKTDVKINIEDSSGDENPVVNEYMPMVTDKEFELITGNLPTKMKNLSTKDNNKNIINIKHEIFKNPLYDANTSGSDTNASEGTLPTPKRRGRRSNILASAQSGEVDDESLKNSEAYLLAKISKQFMGPQASTADQVNEDFAQIGISSNWST